jgi:hypothetical protein
LSAAMMSAYLAGFCGRARREAQPCMLGRVQVAQQGPRHSAACIPTARGNSVSSDLPRQPLMSRLTVGSTTDTTQTVKYSAVLAL